MEILLGCDPEIFVKRDGIFHSAHGLIPGDKKNPFKVDKGAVQVDGMALEFNIEPAHSCEEFVTNISTVFEILKGMVPEYQIVTTPVADFTDEIMKSQPKEALELGCDPDFNAWTGMENVKPDGDRPMRTASGHIHVGWTNGRDIHDPIFQQACNDVAKQLDFFLGLPSLFIDDDVRRRSMYGKAGCVRYKSYGVEYRTLSNVWLSSVDLMKWVYSSTLEAMNQLMNRNKLVDRYGDIQEIINTSNKKQAEHILNEIGILLPKGA